MKLSYQWLLEWIGRDFPLDIVQLREQLTMSGLEVESTDLMGDDHVIDIAITPNRGDCLSVLGIAKEIAALASTPLKKDIQDIKDIPSLVTETIPLTIHQPAECPHYVGRAIYQVDATAKTPMWLQERLCRSGMHSINPVVDVTNYVMLELGQPMHAFDLNTISGGIHVRSAEQGESLELLDGQTKTLNNQTLVIADDKTPLAIAGVMGGMASSVTLATQAIFLESAFFNPQGVARQSRFYQLNSDSSYRFERGIDPLLQSKAIARATELILQICGGQPGPVIEVLEEKYLPQPANILLRYGRIQKILGFAVAAQEVESILTRLGFSLQKIPEGWSVTVPARRSDIVLEVDLIEEIIRLHGYDKLPLHDLTSQLSIQPVSEQKISAMTLRHVLRDMGYHEVISYSFIDEKLQSLFDPEVAPKKLMNPMTAEMAVMRSSLLPGLMQALIYNQNRQQPRAQLFEIGSCFLQQEELKLAGLMQGPALPEQWGIAVRPADFFDIKGDIESLLQLTFAHTEFVFKPPLHSKKYPALHPTQTAEIYRNFDQRDPTSSAHEPVLVGMVGALHPHILQTLDIIGPVFVFELSLKWLTDNALVPRYTPISKFPEIRRDLALIVNQSIPVQALQDTIRELTGDLLKNIHIFDVYQGKGIEDGQKSIAIALALQHASRTLVDEEVADLMERVIVRLKEKFSAELRG